MTQDSLSTGIVKLDNLIDGLQKGKVYMISGRPSMGKSVFVMNIASAIGLRQNKNVLVFYLEGSKQRFVERTVSSECLVDYDGFKKWMFTEADFELINRNVSNVFSDKIKINDNAELSLDGLKKSINSVKDIDAVIIDYIQLVEGYGQRAKVLNDFLIGLKEVATEKNLPIIVVSSLSANCENRFDKRPTLKDLNDDGLKTQFVDVVIFLYRDEFYNVLSENKSITEIIVARNKEGATGTIEAAYIPSKNKFANLEKS